MKLTKVGSRLIKVLVGDTRKELELYQGLRARTRNVPEHLSVLVYATKRMAVRFLVAVGALPQRFNAVDSPVILNGVRYCLGLVTNEGYTFAELYDHRVYEQDPEFIPGLSWVVMDVGANIGVFTIQQARRGARVFAFEPNGESFRRLVKTIIANDLLTFVQPFNCAVGAVPGYGSLHVGGTAGRRTVTGTVQFRTVPPTEFDGSAASSGEQMVRVTSLDLLTDALAIQQVDLLKIDAEGAEVDVLEGAERLLNRVDRVMIEYHSHALLKRCRAVLERAGFTVGLQVPSPSDGDCGIVYAKRSN